jgi:anti-sigma regulatory factor (Ser/Thr protein kinase)
MSELNAQFDLPLGPEAAGAARRATRTVLHSWGYTDPGWLDHAEIVISELVTNAVKHGGGCLSLDLQAHEEHVTVAAADGTAVVPRRRDDPDSDGGRGLLLIEALSTRWGVHDHHGGKRVYVQLRPHPRRTAPTSPPAAGPGD